MQDWNFENIAEPLKEAVKKFEGYRALPYICAGGILTIGWGHTDKGGGGIKAGVAIDRVTAEKFLDDDLRHAYKTLSLLCKVPLTTSQQIALTSFIFNLGEHAFTYSTLLQKLNQGHYEEAANEFNKWVFAKKTKLPGLVKRRKEEKRIFLS